MTGYTPYHSQYLAHRITLQGVDDDAFAKALTTARVDMNPHQVDAALFALKSPLAKGAILADEVGLGKTIEAALVIAQKWAERKRRILLVLPASLRKQWAQELWEKFSLPSIIMETRSYNQSLKAGVQRPFEADGKVVITSYEFAARKADDLARVDWNLVIFDEAHRLRNVYRKGASVRAKALRDSLKTPFKLLLTATPLQNNIMELYGLVSMIDEKAFGDESSFRTLYAGASPDPAHLAILRKRLEPICRRTLRKTVQQAGHISYTRRIPVTFRFEPHQQELDLYERVSAFLQRPDTCYLGGKPNALVTMSLRKILGSSSFAIAQTLTRIIERLQKQQALDEEDLADIDIIDETAEELDETDEAPAETGAKQPPKIEAPSPERIRAEIAELMSYCDLARSIGANAKGERLIREIPNSSFFIVASDSVPFATLGFCITTHAIASALTTSSRTTSSRYRKVVSLTVSTSGITLTPSICRNSRFFFAVGISLLLPVHSTADIRSPAIFQPALRSPSPLTPRL
jgi:SNF2 family DNA or RNA helicase